MLLVFFELFEKKVLMRPYIASIRIFFHTKFLNLHFHFLQKLGLELIEPYTLKIKMYQLLNIVLQMCLEYYKMDSPAVINAVLEENLPPYLKSLDFSLPQITADLQQVIPCA